MLQPSKTVLIANSIVAKKNTKTLRCWLCDEESSSSKNWLDHILTREHSLRLKHFEASAFVNQGSSGFYCDLCSQNYDWSCLASHAKDHKIAPWYRPVDLYKIFFDNRILALPNNLYCYACDKIFCDWSLALRHADESRHVEELKAKTRMGNNQRSLDLTGTGIVHEWLVYNGMYTDKGGNFCCKICNCYDIAIKCFDEHVAGSRHRNNKFRLIDSLRVRTDREIVEERMSENRITLEKQERDNNYWCDYCKCRVVGLERVTIHLEGQRHRIARWDPKANGEVSGIENASIKSRKDPITINKEPIRINKDAITIDKGSITINNEPIRINKDSVTIDKDPITINKDATGINKEPITINEDLIRINKNPITIIKDPMTINKNAIRINKDPITINKGPITTNKEPIRINDDPITMNNDPITIDQDPITINKGPITIIVEPIRVNEDPITIDKDPITINKNPTTINKDPTRINEDPTRINKYQITINKDPITINEDLIRINKNPITINKGPITINKDPITINKNRIRMNKEPITINKDLITINKDLIRINKNSITTNKGPITINKDSITMNKDPITINKDLIGINKNPITINKDPITINKDPITINKDTITKIREIVKKPLDGAVSTDCNSKRSKNGDSSIYSENQPIASLTRKQPIDGAIKDEISLLSNDYIIRCKDTTYKCKICRSNIHDNDDIRSHVLSQRHIELREEFHDNKITYKQKNGKWNCYLCRCNVNGLDPVIDHIDKKAHMLLLYDSMANDNELRCKNTKKIANTIDELNEPIEKREIVKKSLNDTNYEKTTFLHDYIVKRGNTDSYCTICKCMIYSETQCELHISGKRHVRRLEKLKNMELTGKGMDKWQIEGCYVKRETETIVCDTNKEQQSLNEQVDFSRDYIVSKDNDDFYCTICDYTIVDRECLKFHVIGVSHVRRRKKFRTNDITFEENKYRCNVCIYENSCLDEISQHINQRKHIKARLKCQNLSYIEKPNSSVETLKEKLNEKLKEKMNEIKLNDYISWSDDKTNGFCKICDKGMMNCNDIAKHCETRRHIGFLKKLTSNKIVYKQNDDYLCEYCNFQILDITAVKEHIKQIEHRRLKKNQWKNQKIPNSKVSEQLSNDTLTINPLSQNFIHEYIVKINSTNSFCKICNFNINEEQQDINEHLIGIDHSESLKKYNCENIILVDYITRDYYCKSCDCPIKCDGEIWRHAIGHRHRSIFTSIILERNLQKKFDKSKDVTMHNVKISFSSKLCKQQIRDLSISVICEICKNKLSNIVEYHSHLAGHFSKDFLGIDDNDQSNEKADKDNENLTIDSLNVIDESHPVIDENPEDDDSSVSSKMTEVRNEIPRKIAGTLELKAKLPNIERIRKIVNFDNNIIYSMIEKFRLLELGWIMSYEKCSSKIYCLVCHIMTEFTRENYHEHLWNLEHCINFERMERDHKLFAEFPKQFSEIDLCLEYMEEISLDLVVCHACEVKISPYDDSLREHMMDSSHARDWQLMRDLTMKNFDKIRINLSCDWYKIKTYRCVPCLLTFNSEVNFSEHMESNNHLECMEKMVNKKRQIIYDFCEACALLWYGYRKTCAYHRINDTHLWLLRDGYYLSEKLPKNAIELLRITEDYVKETIRINDASIDEESSKEKLLIRDMEMSVGQKYHDAKAHIFGSRVTRVGSLNCDIDVFLDCGDMYNGKIKSNDLIVKFMDNVAECLNKLPETWIVEEIIKTCRSPIIKIHHIPTGLSCDISFQNGLGVEKTYLIKSYIDAFPLCREMIIFLKRWTTLCELSERITSFAIYWHVIFYLQQETILPSIEQLIKFKNQSRTVDGWEVSAERDFSANLANTNFSIGQLLTKFFDFWSKFDYRYDVACPMIGKILKKRDFIGTMEITDSTSFRYDDYVKKSMERGPLRIDSAMCLQDPLDLRYNITQTLSKVYVNRFRKYCSFSRDILAGT